MLIRIHLVVNVSQVVWYKKQVEGQKAKEMKPIKVEEVKEWEVKKILNKRKGREVVKYLVLSSVVHTGGESLQSRLRNV